MFISNKISTLISKKLIQQNIITKSDLPYYQYSLDFTLELLIFNSSLIIIGLLLGTPFYLYYIY